MTPLTQPTPLALPNDIRPALLDHLASELETLCREVDHVYPEFSNALRWRTEFDDIKLREEEGASCIWEGHVSFADGGFGEDFRFGLPRNLVFTSPEGIELTRISFWELWNLANTPLTLEVDICQDDTGNPSLGAHSRKLVRDLVLETLRPRAEEALSYEDFIAGNGGYSQPMRFVLLLGKDYIWRGELIGRLTGYGRTRKDFVTVGAYGKEPLLDVDLRDIWDRFGDDAAPTLGLDFED